MLARWSSFLGCSSHLPLRFPCSRCLPHPEAGSRVRGDIHTDIRGNGGTNREPEIQRSRVTDWERSMRWFGSDDSDSVYWSHLRSTSQSLPHHCLRCSPSLPLDPSPWLHRRPSLRFNLCFLRSQRLFPPIHVWRSHCSFHYHSHWPSFRPRIPHYLQSPLCGYRCRH